MRKTVLIWTMLLIGSLSYAQIEKGNILIGGSVTFDTRDANNGEFDFFTFSPRAGFFLSDRTSLGLILGFEKSSSEQTSLGGLDDSSFDIFTFGAYMRNYKPLSEKLFFFLQSSITYGTGGSEVISPNFNRETDQTRFNISLIPGLAYFISDRLALDVRLAAVTYQRESIDNLLGNNETRNFTSINVSGGLTNVGFGLSWFLK